MLPVDTNELELRDYFAAAAMQAALAKYPTDAAFFPSSAGRERVARDAYAMADAMMEERKRE